MDPISAIATAIAGTTQTVNLLLSDKYNKADQAMKARVGWWKRIYDQACIQKITMEEVIATDQTVYGDQFRSRGSINNWLANDGNMNIAYSIFAEVAPPGFSLYKKNCTLLTNPYFKYGAIAIALIIFLVILKSILK